MTSHLPSSNSAAFPAGKRAAISLTFDDARLSQPDVGFDLFDRLGLRVTFYVSPQNVEPRLPAWQRAAAAGHEIGNHTFTHPCSINFPWSRHKAIENMTLAQMEQDILQANHAIHQLLGVTPKTFAYPCGQTYVGRGRDLQSYIPLVANHFLARRGFRTEAVNDPLLCDLAQLCAHDSDCHSFAALKPWIDMAVEQGSWLVLAGHEIGTTGRQTTLISALEELAAYCQQRQDIWLDSVANVASHLTEVQQQHSTHGEQRCTA